MQVGRVKTRKPKGDTRLSLHGISFKDAVRGILAAPPEPRSTKPKARRKRK